MLCHILRGYDFIMQQRFGTEIDMWVTTKQ